MTQVDLNAVLQQMGELIGEMRGLTGKIDRLQSVFNSGEQNARESRAGMHRRLDEQSAQIAHLDKTVAIAGQIDAQIRDEVKAVSERVQAHYDELAPAVNDWKHTRRMGIRLFGLLSIGGFSVASALAYFGHAAWAAFREWLKGVLG